MVLWNAGNALTQRKKNDYIKNSRKSILPFLLFLSVQRPVIGSCRFSVRIFCAQPFSFSSAFTAEESISLIRFSWLTSLAPGS